MARPRQQPLPRNTPDPRSWSAEWALRDKARERATAAHGERVHAVQVKPQIKTKVVTTPAAGKPVLKWQSGAHRLFDTKTEALRYARENAKANDNAISVRQVRVWPDSDFQDKTVAVQVACVTVSATAEVTVTLATPKRAVTPVEGWLFFGLAAC